MDWNQRDNELVIEIQTAVKRLYTANKPVQVNISRIGKEIGKLALLERHLDKLPMTASYINKVTETRDRFQSGEFNGQQDNYLKITKMFLNGKLLVLLV